ncbi:tyrosine-type recombinase/integrase [Cellulomonas sp. RIT-PI-Y]|uniref:tyrosine-type recombinase/integrase n=1 Tax=Cellulomonas sp. RIT-PI-Y TaxID=3035297 RepID=UPI0021DB276E|nr:tyrosine-type recombinase/integrase [Cellulomonas sp. RIT-PI-Y]
MDWATALQEYRTYLMSVQFSAGSIRVHSSYLRRLALEQRRGPWATSTKDLRRFLADSRWQANTRRSARASVVKFFRWAYLEGYIEQDPAARLEPVSVPAAVPRPAPWSVVDRAIRLSAQREATMLRLARYAALRCCEIATAHRDNWDGRGLWVEGKGGKARYVPIENRDVVAAIERAEGWLFSGRVDGHLSAGTVSRLMSQALSGAWTGHKLRHAFATTSNSRHPDLLALQKVMGHARPETTQVYTHVPVESLLEVVRAGAPEQVGRVPAAPLSEGAGHADLSESAADDVMRMLSGGVSEEVALRVAAALIRLTSATRA